MTTEAMITLFLAVVFISFNLVDLDMVFIMILIKSMAAVYSLWMGVKGVQESEVTYEGGQRRKACLIVFGGCGDNLGKSFSYCFLCWDLTNINRH